MEQYFNRSWETFESSLFKEINKMYPKINLVKIYKQPISIDYLKTIKIVCFIDCKKLKPKTINITSEFIEDSLGRITGLKNTTNIKLEIEKGLIDNF